MTARVQSSAGRPTARGTAVVDLLSVLYPPPLDVRLSPERRASARASWTAIPSADNPRLLVPTGGRTAATRMLRRQLTGTRPRTRIARAGLSLALLSGGLGRLPRLRLGVLGPADAPSIEDSLREALGVAEMRLTMSIGPARSNRKPVLQVSDAHGRVLAFAKVGHNPLTRRLVRQEGDALRTLGAASLKEVRAPRLLACHEWSGLEVLVLEPLDIPARRLTGAAGRERLLAVVRELADIGGRSVIEWRRHPLRAALLDRFESCGAAAAELRSQIERIGPGLPLTTGSWHGDLNPGNLALVTGACPVWDWERFESGVPAGFDLLHHDLHEAITVRGTPPLEAARGLLAASGEHLATLGLGPGQAEATARLYLVTLASRYLADEQRRAGGDLGRVHEWLFPALEEARP